MGLVGIDKEKLRLRTALMFVEDKLGDNFDVSLNIDNKALFFEFPEARYMITMYDLIDAVLDFREQHLKEANDEHEG